MLDGMLCYAIDNCRFMNHEHDDPNVIDKPEGSYAVRDIKAGEELTCNYFLLGANPEDVAFNVHDIEHLHRKEEVKRSMGAAVPG